MVVGLAVVVVVGGVLGAWAAVSASSAFCTFLLTASCWACESRLMSDCTLSVCLLPRAEQLHRRVDQPGALHGIDGLGLGHPGCGDGPLRPALELDAEVQPAPQDDGDDPDHDDGRRDAEPDLALAHEVEAGLAAVEAGDGAVAPSGLGQQGAGGVVEADELLLVEVLRVDALLEALDVLFAHVVEGAAVPPVSSAAAAVGVAHEPPPAPAPTGRPCACGPAPSPVAMLNAP